MHLIYSFNPVLIMWLHLSNLFLQAHISLIFRLNFINTYISKQLTKWGNRKWFSMLPQGFEFNHLIYSFIPVPIMWVHLSNLFLQAHIFSLIFRLNFINTYISKQLTKWGNKKWFSMLPQCFELKLFFMCQSAILIWSKIWTLWGLQRLLQSVSHFRTKL